MRVTAVTPPPPVISLDEAKRHLRLDEENGDEDALIAAYIAAAQGHIDGPDGWLGRAIGPQTLEVSGDLFDCGPIALPLPPVINIVSIKYDDPAGAEQVLPNNAYALRGSSLSAAWGKSWPATRSSIEPVRIRYQAGYAALPFPVRAAILLMVGDLWSFRTTAVTGTISSSIPMLTTVERLLAPFRIYT